VEDDGVGIAPADFREDGGLGRLHCKCHSVAAIVACH
jgi:hypothetical protein